MSRICLSKKTLDLWATTRKMDLAELISSDQFEGEAVCFSDYQDVCDLAKKLNVQLSELFREYEKNDLDYGVKICRNSTGFRRENIKNGTKMYTYQHLVTTHLLPQMMPIRCTVHNNNFSEIHLNGGHDYQEMIVVSRGKIRVYWQKDSDQVQHVDLGVGDSTYIAPKVRHSFLTLEGDSEILAFNF